MSSTGDLRLIYKLLPEQAVLEIARVRHVDTSREKLPLAGGDTMASRTVTGDVLFICAVSRPPVARAAARLR